jgi:hypothetical protein
MVDYARLQATATRLITKYGRTATFVKLDSAASDPLEPWHGATNPRGTGAVALNVKVVQVEPESDIRLGEHTIAYDFIKESSRIFIASASADLKQFNEVLDDDGSRWNIVGMEGLRPGSINLIYFVGLAEFDDAKVRR